MVSILRKFRQYAYAAQNGRCFYCDQPLLEQARPAGNHGVPAHLTKFLCSTAEHLRARQDGGKVARSNIVAACYWCNTRRHLHRSHCAPEANTYRNWVQKMVIAGKWHPVAIYRAAQRSPAAFDPRQTFGAT